MVRKGRGDRHRASWPLRSGLLCLRPSPAAADFRTSSNRSRLGERASDRLRVQIRGRPGRSERRTLAGRSPGTRGGTPRPLRRERRDRGHQRTIATSDVVHRRLAERRSRIAAARCRAGPSRRRGRRRSCPRRRNCGGSGTRYGTRNRRSAFAHALDQLLQAMQRSSGRSRAGPSTGDRVLRRVEVGEVAEQEPARVPDPAVRLGQAASGSPSEIRMSSR